MPPEMQLFIDLHQGSSATAIYSSPRLLGWEAFMPKKPQKRRPWTKAEVRKLKTLAKRKTPATNIAWTLKRTEGAIRQKAFSLGLSLETRARSLTPQPLQPSVDQAIGLKRAYEYDD